MIDANSSGAFTIEEEEFFRAGVLWSEGQRTLDADEPAEPRKQVPVWRRLFARKPTQP